VDPDAVACLIPARSGSSRIPDKNLQLVGGTTLHERAERVSLDAFGSAVVSTDSARYADIAKRAGATVPALRPAALATDVTTMDEVVQHALTDLLPASCEVLVLVQPTSPFTAPSDLLEVVAALEAAPVARCALTVEALPASDAFALARGADGLSRFLAPHLASMRTQDLPAIHKPTGGAFAARVERLRAGGALVEEPFAVVEVPPSRAIDVDDPEDLAAAQSRST
jgi:CMP-N-acetylneuraminic acid synthetase